MFIGRYQVGDWVPLRLHAQNGSLVASEPSAQPTAKVYDASGNLDATVNLVIRQEGRVTGLYASKLQITAAMGTGWYTVLYEWTITSGFKDVECFEVVAGGNEAGALIGLCSFRRPVSNHLVFLTDNGTLYQGRNPY